MESCGAPPDVVTVSEPAAVSGAVVARERESEWDAAVSALEKQYRLVAFQKIFINNMWKDAESRSGPGSTVRYTENTRTLLAQAFKSLEVSSVFDVPCGDCNWQPQIEGFSSVQYVGYDVVPQLIERNRQHFKDLPNMRFGQLDFIADALPPGADFVLCRDAIMHNTLRDGVKAFLNFERSGAKFLATTWYHWPENTPNTLVNRIISPGDFFRVDVFRPPFNFSMPLLLIAEGHDGGDIRGKMLAVWKLPCLGLGDGKPLHLPPDLLEQSRHRVVRADEILGKSPR